MAYQPNDDRFYDTLSDSGRTYQKYRDKVAEDQAATTRELGRIYGQALPNTVNAAMKGADWAMKRGADQQKMDLAESEEGRAQEGADRAATKFGWEGEDRDATLAAAKKAAEYDAMPATEEEAAMAAVPYHPNMTHADIKDMARTQALGKDMRENEIKRGEEAGRNTRQTEEIGSKERLSGDTIAGEDRRAAQRLNFDEKKLAQEGTLEHEKLAQPKPATGEQVKTAGFAQTAKYNGSIVDKLEKGDPDKRIAPYDPADRLKKVRDTDLPLIGRNDNDRLYDAAKSEFISAVLRPESGAVLGPSEVSSKGESLFPQAGDSPKVIASKRDRRHELTTQLEQAAGEKATAQVAGSSHRESIAPPPDAANGVAYGGDDNMNLAPEDLQAAMRNRANAPQQHPPIHKMTKEEKKAELRSRGINPDD